MIPFNVVVRDILVQRSMHRALAKEMDLRQTLLFKRSYPAFPPTYLYGPPHVLRVVLPQIPVEELLDAHLSEDDLAKLHQRSRRTSWLVKLTDELMLYHGLK
jgi:ribosomal protein L16 Arg81 hydroxylase